MIDNTKRSFPMSDLFTDAQLKRAMRIVHGSATPNAQLIDEIVTPRMGHINRVTGQQNDARYIAYALEAAVGEAAVVGAVARLVERM